MALCLFDSLRAVGLQHHYDRFSSLGVHSLAHLSVLTMEDYPLLGIRTMDDRTRLFHLVQALKTLDLESLEDSPSDELNDYKTVEKWTTDSYEPVLDDENVRWNDMSSVCRQLDFSSETTHQTEKPFLLTLFTSSNPKEPVSKPNVYNCLPEKKHTEKVIKTHTEGEVSSNSLSQNSLIKLKHDPMTAKPRRTSTKPAGNKENGTPQRNRKSHKASFYTEMGNNEAKCFMRNTPVFESNTSEYNYGLPSSPSTPSKRRGGDHRIWVCVRKRPLTSAEKRRRETDVVSTPNENCVAVHESKEAVDLTHYILQHRFYFDHVFGEDCSNDEVYLRTAYPLVLHMLSGGSGTCFAYGQTGAGKTHTMLGSCPAGAGLYALAVRDIFAHLSTSGSRSQLSVFVSFFEIYCGQLYDLLENRKRLFAREDGQKTVHIAGLCHVRVDSVNSLLEVISRGTEERTQGCSGVNPLSSRSHALLQVQLRDPHQRVYGRMWFVDLAGSERASDSKEPDRQSRIEGAEINQSLLALKECIRSLDQEQSHTPFRQSKLTQVLKDSFVGDCMTCMIANVSPVHSAAEHTLNTLRYADRVKELKGQSGRRRTDKTEPSPKRNLSHSSNSSGSSGPRTKSPSKRPKLVQQCVPTTSSPVRTSTSPEFLSSTPTSRSERTRVRKIFGRISPVKSQTRAEKHETNGLENQGIEGEFHSQSKSGCNREESTSKRETMASRQNVKAESNGDFWKKLVQLRTDLPDKDTDYDRKRHLKLYHQQLQQFVPTFHSLSSSKQTSFSSPRNVSSPMPSTIHMDKVFGQYKAHSNKVQLCLEKGKAGLVFRQMKNGDHLEGKGDLGEDWRDCKEENGEKLRENGGRCGKKGIIEGEKSKDGREKWAWATEKEEKGRVQREMSNEGFYFERFGELGVCANAARSDETENNHKIKQVPDPRAPVERPLSPVCEHSKSLLTLSALNTSPESKIPTVSQDTAPLSPKEKKGERQSGNIASSLPQEETHSGVMDPLTLSLLELDQQAATASFLEEKCVNKEAEIQGKEQQEECFIPVCVEGEEEESYVCLLELPKVQTFCSSALHTVADTDNPSFCATVTSFIPVAIQVLSQKKEEALKTKPDDEAAGASSIQSSCLQSSSSNDTNNSPKHDHHIFNEKQSSCLPSRTTTEPNPGDSSDSIHLRRARTPKEESGSHHLSATEDVFKAHRQVVQAHLEMLKEMEVLSQKEGTLLCQQPDMAFGDFVQQLEQIMERKALCVLSLRAQLQQYLKCSPSSDQQ